MIQSRTAWKWLDFTRFPLTPALNVGYRLKPVGSWS